MRMKKMPKREKPTVTSKVVKVDGREIHMLSMTDGSVVSEKDMQEYSLGLTIKSNRQVQANAKSAEDKKRQDSSPVKEFKILPHQNREFVFDLASGVEYCARKYNATEVQIRKEAQRIAPDMLI
jgi:hypothetical protein